MNKRIKKKRMKLNDRHIGDHSYSATHIIKKEYIYDEYGLIKGGEKMEYNSSTFYSFKRRPLPEGYFKENNDE